jgi:AraC family transcriptional regulator, regulatory protein of adaptative response / methylated-DNA-[protein]-cysteine methyltransferase
VAAGRWPSPETFETKLTPNFKAGGKTEQIRFALGQCSLGAILVAATVRGVCAISLGGEPEELLHELERQFPRAELVGGDAEFEGWVAQVVALVRKRELLDREGKA